MGLQAYIGIAAGILAFTALPIYITDILRGNTKPSKVTWWVLALSSSMLAVSYFASGARDTIWIPVAYIVMFLIVAVLSTKYGEGGWTILDTVSLIGVFVSALIWFFFSSPELALLAIVGVEFFGLIPTFYKSYEKPFTESKLAWQIATLASLLNIFAIETWTFAVALYPFYVFITNGIILYFLMFPRTNKSL